MTNYPHKVKSDRFTWFDQQKKVFIYMQQQKERNSLTFLLNK